MKNYILMIFACVFWAGAFIAGKSSVASFGPWSLTFYRFAVAALIMAPFLLATQRKYMTLSFKQVRQVVILGLVGMVGYHVLFFEALKFTEASTASMIAATNPVVTAFILALTGVEKLSIKKVMYLLLALFGVLLTISNWQLSVLLNLKGQKGELLMVLAVSCWAVYSVLVKKYIAGFKPVIMSFYAFFCCALISLPFALHEGLVKSSIVAPRGAWFSILYMSLFASVLGYWIQQSSIQKIGPAKTNIFINIVPVFSMTMAWLLLGESIGIYKVVSGCIIIFAVINFNMLSFKNQSR